MPVVNADMVSYSSYDSSSIRNGPDAATTRASMNEALNAIKSLAPDPLDLGDKRILISEYGLFENERTPADVQWRTQTILETSQAASLLGAFMWQVFDNECYKDYPTNKQPFPVDCSPGDPERPLNTQCRGLWIVKPDENPGAALPLMAQWFKPSTSGVTLTGRVTSTSGGGVANALISFYGGQATADANGNYSLTNVPPSVPPAPATAQFTASAPGYQSSSQSVVVSASNNPTINFALRPSTDAGSITGKVISAVDGAALAGVTISYSGQSASSDASGNFHFDTVLGGTYNFSAQHAGWVTETIVVNIQPGIPSMLNLRLATGGQLNGQINNNSGAGVAGASVNAHGGLVPTNVTVVTNSSGAFSFGWLPVGDYYLVVTADGYVQDDPQNATATLTVGATTSKTLTHVSQVRLQSHGDTFEQNHHRRESGLVYRPTESALRIQRPGHAERNRPADECDRQLQPGDDLLRHVNAHGHHQFDNARGQLHPHDFRRRHGPAALHASHPDGERRTRDRHRQSDQRRQRGADQRGQSI